jgi:hypothetical protein
MKFGAGHFQVRIHNSHPAITMLTQYQFSFLIQYQTMEPGSPLRGTEPV